ncbi:MAG: GTPase HflX [Puniceicoccales bacterium]|jgi:GTP-binding protein HflX|nr:GTPase HflX [Puniceicoccales bacterium]
MKGDKSNCNNRDKPDDEDKGAASRRSGKNTRGGGAGEGEAQTAFLVGLQRHGQEPAEAAALLGELRELVANLAVPIAGSVVVRLREDSPRLLVGSGKAVELAAEARAVGANLLVFDDELSAAQQRNWERDTGLRVIDRQEVILDIFAARASTREAVLQVRLAQLEHQLPRLKHLWSHLDRQRGGGSTQRDAGEKQIEMDQRLIRERIAKVRAELDDVIRRRATQRKQRRRVPVPSAAIVGYTNAGKSSLLNALTGAGVYAADKLFATLDPVTRRLTLPGGRTLLLTDTVGFVRRLPHRLVEAFKATLEEAVRTDFLIHVVDLSSPEHETHWRTTREVLTEIGAADKPILTVFNKTDACADDAPKFAARAQHPDAQFVSAKTGAGLSGLLAILEERATAGRESASLLIPHDRHDFLGELHTAGAVLSERHTAEGVVVEALLPPRLQAAAAAFATQKKSAGKGTRRRQRAR